MKVWHRLITITILAIVLFITGCSNKTSGNPLIGKKAPDFTTISIDNTPVKLSDYRGKPVVINFWAIRCSYCRDEMPYLQQVYEDYSAEGLIILGIDNGESLGNVKPFTTEYGYRYTILLDTDSSIANEYGVYYLPATYFIDKDGIIRDITIIPFESKADIEKYLTKIM
jgi:peroxiredoxin